MGDPTWLGFAAAVVLAFSAAIYTAYINRMFSRKGEKAARCRRTLDEKADSLLATMKAVEAEINGSTSGTANKLTHLLGELDAELVGFASANLEAVSARAMTSDADKASDELLTVANGYRAYIDRKDRGRRYFYDEAHRLHARMKSHLG